MIRVQGSGAISYSRLRWRSWGTSRAQAKGRQCSGRTGGCQTASIRLSDRKTIHGRLVYTCLRPLLPGEVKICSAVARHEPGTLPTTSRFWGSTVPGGERRLNTP